MQSDPNNAHYSKTVRLSRKAFPCATTHPSFFRFAIDFLLRSIFFE
jgi:hypothetical protein